MGYFSELDITKPQKTEMIKEPSNLERLESWICYLEDKLSSLESGKYAEIQSDDFFYDAVSIYDYDDPDSAYGLRIAIKNTKEKIEAEYDKNMERLQWKLSAIFKGELPDGQLVFSDAFGTLTEAA